MTMRLCCLLLAAVAPTAAYEYSSFSPPTFDVLVYGSTPGGIIAAVAAARHGATTALLSQRAHIGGVCAGGLGQTDIGGCAEEVIGGLPLEFFKRNAQSYATPQPRSPWNLEPHMRAMLEEDKHWVAANARYLAKVALEGYRGALEAA